ARGRPSVTTGLPIRGKQVDELDTSRLAALLEHPLRRIWVWIAGVLERCGYRQQYESNASLLECAPHVLNRAPPAVPARVVLVRWKVGRSVTRRVEHGNGFNAALPGQQQTALCGQHRPRVRVIADPVGESRLLRGCCLGHSTVDVVHERNFEYDHVRLIGEAFL